MVVSNGTARVICRASSSWCFRDTSDASTYMGISPAEPGAGKPVHHGTSTSVMVVAALVWGLVLTLIGAYMVAGIGGFILALVDSWSPSCPGMVARRARISSRG